MKWRWLAIAVVLVMAGMLWVLPTKDPLDVAERPGLPVAQEAEHQIGRGKETAIEPSSKPKFATERVVFQIPEASEMSTLPPHPLVDKLATDALPPGEEPAAVLRIFGVYREAYGSYPSGEDNAQLMNALRGGNPDKRAIFSRENPRLSGEGELLDGYGTPFFFHLLSSQAMEVRSAGADREFYTNDDVVAADGAAKEPDPTE